MNSQKQPVDKINKSTFMPTQAGLLQRKCACGNRTVAGGECEECAKKKTNLQRKLTIGASNDPLEQEADRVAEQVLAMPVSPAVSQAKPNIQRYTPQSSAQSEEVPASVDRVLGTPGKPLDTPLRRDMESRFGHDFSQVRVHTGSIAEQSARDVDAHAYTVGRNIVFGSRQFAPTSQEGRRLLAHELTHVIQQAGVLLTLQCDKQEGKAKDKDTSQQAAPTKPEPGTAYVHIVVRDSGLDLGGGVLVSDLADAKTKLITRKVDKPWTLVLAIHASENLLGAQSGPDWKKNAIFYDESDIKKLFGGDSAFVAWRDRFGPNRIVLYGCQVTAAFEQTIADNLVRGGKAPSAGGLGEGCKPRATVVTFDANNRKAFDKLADTEKVKMLEEVKIANETWGYYGGRSVPSDQVLDYLFDSPKPGSWTKVEVIVKQGDKYVPTKPPIPYWNRLSNPEYLRQCTKAVGNLREHKPQAPTVREGE